MPDDSEYDRGPDADYFSGMGMPVAPRMTPEEKQAVDTEKRAETHQQRIERARETARKAAERGIRVHLFSSISAAEVGPVIEGFEAEGWVLAEFSTHFRDFRITSALGKAGAIGKAGLVEIMAGATEKRELTGSGKTAGWESADVYVMLFRYGAPVSTR